MSGIVGSYHNIRGSGVVNKLGTDGQVFTSAGAGVSQGFEDAAGGGRATLIKSITASSSASVEFEDGTSNVVLDNTYAKYLIEYKGVHPQTDNVIFSFNASSDTGANYNVEKTFHVRIMGNQDSGAHEDEGQASQSLENDTGVCQLGRYFGNEATEAAWGYMILWDPSNTTFYKHFESWCLTRHKDDGAYLNKTHGLFNTTSVVDSIIFTMSSGNIDAGVFTLYGIATS